MSVVIVKIADCELSLTDAVMVAVLTAETPVVVTVKVAFVAPDGTVTVDGTVAFMVPEESVKVVPPEGAAEPKVIVPVKGVPPATVVVLKESRVLPLWVNWATGETLP